MASVKEGERVGALLEINESKVELLGYGVYEGDHLRPGWESTLPLMFGFDRDPQRVSEEVLAADGAFIARLRAGDGTEPTEEELKAAVDGLRADRVAKAGLSDAELTEIYLANESNALLYNPRLRLDNGEVWWGCEVWWGPEERVKAKVAAFRERGAQITTRTRAEFDAEREAKRT